VHNSEIVITRDSDRSPYISELFTDKTHTFVMLAICHAIRVDEHYCRHQQEANEITVSLKNSGSCLEPLRLSTTVLENA